MANKKIAIVGAGIFGCSIALELDKKNFHTVLFEKEQDIMLLASKNNHNRIHYGYHYPRSLDTTIQSLRGYNSFKEYYGDSLVSGFRNYYAIAKEGSYISSEFYKEFCDKAGISYESSYPDEYLLNSNLVSDCFLTEEPVYDWESLQNIIKHKISKSKIDLRISTDYTKSNEEFDFVINCSYSNINKISEFHNVKGLSFRKQDIIIPIFKSKMERIGLTVMDGPFCSILPKGKELNKFLLYHAKYSIVEETLNSDLKLNSNINSSINIILEKSKIFYPFLKNVDIIDYWRTSRVIPITKDDARVSEIITYKNNPKFISVFSGKVSTAILIAKQISVGLKQENFNI
ncbi:FAD-binding oxidoreductase [Flavobacteriaceae bacterium]|nr:FAD-binding oxidoreductase [Flavobacteriaceae bacterium]MDA9192732.1 FAD-binding oxidoreductase [Flavobacteriaceae bacterium]